MNLNRISIISSLVLSLSLHFLYMVPLNAKPVANTVPQPEAYLFVYFTGNGKGEEEIRFAISKDGYHFKSLNRNQPVLSSTEISASGGVRDPHILRTHDQKGFYMVATDMVSAKGWDSNRGIVLMKSKDLIKWTTSRINIPESFKEFQGVNRVWAPQTIYDPVHKKYMIYFSMRKGSEPDKIYYAYANKDFTGLETEPRQLFFHPDSNACIDGDIILKDGKYHLTFKTEGSTKGLGIAVSKSLTTGYQLAKQGIQQTTDPVEGAGVFKLNGSNTYILMYDIYTKGKYQFTKTTDFEHFTVVDEQVSMDFHPRHGTVMPITKTEAEALMDKWFSADDVFSTLKGPGIKANNLVLDTAAKMVSVPVNDNITASAFKGSFLNLPGLNVKKLTVNEAKGTLNYRVQIGSTPAVTYQVSLKKFHNPVLPGYFADPEIMYSEKNRLFYLYPTSDGFTGWSGTYFKAFSSPDLVTWKDEGVILDLNKDVSWAKRNAWAPCIIEKKIDGKFKYFYYYTAAQKIGVAVADDPAGPFKDTGKPLVENRPEGTRGGQLIDPDVFTDPQTGKSYLYWGNGYLAGAELNADMISMKAGTTVLLTPDRTFREGTYVFYRNGQYYFTWSEDDTRSVNYKVRYGTSSGPLSKITVPENNIVISKSDEKGIYGTGHNSVIQVPGKDEWYLVYHRFTYPTGIKMGSAAGYNREVCIDRLTFKADGSIQPVTPTHEGIKAVTVR
ncbi:family 43 glycosylhydrolase [Mucilaginibacter sp. PAMB04168]|uniref:family 43 glycosylhydrolase n=1 Tax=Mucilaginibacter sp. PAMB04168 TaxID=3138567 RepID=UPI0031F607F2